MHTITNNQQDYYEQGHGYEPSEDVGLFVYRAREKHVSNPKHLKWTVNLKLKNSNTELSFKIDTGADCSCISSSTYKDYIKSGLVCSPTTITGIAKSIGRVSISVMYKNKAYQMTCEVIDHPIPNLVSLDDSLRMNLIKRVDHASKVGTHQSPTVKCPSPETREILEEYEDVFRGVGKIPGEISLKIDQSATAIAHSPRPVPAALGDAVKAKLAEMEEEGIIEKIPPGTPTPWCAPMHIVLKKSRSQNDGPVTKDDIRITIDPQDLNKALLREYHPINTIDQVITQTHGSTLYTKLDARQGFFQLFLDEQSSLLTVFNMPYGWYKHNVY